MAGDANADALDTPKTIFLKRNDERRRKIEDQIQN